MGMFRGFRRRRLDTAIQELKFIESKFLIHGTVNRQEFDQHMMKIALIIDQDPWLMMYFETAIQQELDSFPYTLAEINRQEKQRLSYTK